MEDTTIQKTRLLMYGRDPVLLDTRSLILRMAGFEVDTVVGLHPFKEAVAPEASPFRLAILCHTVPENERKSIAELAGLSRTQLFQIEALISPNSLIREVSRMAGSAPAL